MGNTYSYCCGQEVKNKRENRLQNRDKENERPTFISSESDTSLMPSESDWGRSTEQTISPRITAPQLPQD